MRVADIMSALTLNVILALFSMVMAIIALGLLAFVLAKDNYIHREVAKIPPREKIKRHESTVVDFRNPSSVPDHFLQLNTLMFQKKPKNNQITKVQEPIIMPSMDRMLPSLDEERFATKELPPIPPIEESDVSSNRINPRFDRHRRGENNILPMNNHSSPFVTDSGFSEDDSDTASTNSTEATDNISEMSSNVSMPGSSRPPSTVWIIENNTIEPRAQKVIVDLDCNSEVSLC